MKAKSQFRAIFPSMKWIPAAALLGVFAFPIYAQPVAKSSPTSDAESPYADIETFARALQLVRQEYVDEHKAGYQDLIYSALRGMLADLDPHSQFMEPEDFRGMQEETKSEFGGLGVTITLRNGFLTIVSPLEDGPGFKAGLLPGDQVVKINGTSTDKLTLSDAVEMLRGEVGQKITLTINRPATKQLKDYELTRAVIKVPSVKDVKMLSEEKTGGRKIGYVRLTQFNEPTASELAKALDKLEKQGMQGLILDLRYNPGGLLGSAVDVCGQFLPPNTKVVYTEGKTSAVRREYRTGSKSTKRRDYPVAVLVNYASASGSEIVAGALKDLDRAVLVGETTFGKGSVQSVISLPDGSALRLTTAKYYTPGKQLIHEHGVTPHIRATMSYDEEAALYRARRDGDTDPDGGAYQPVLTDPQLDRAVDALEGMLVYADRTKSKTAVTR